MLIRQIGVGAQLRMKLLRLEALSDSSLCSALVAVLMLVVVELQMVPSSSPLRISAWVLSTKKASNGGVSKAVMSVLPTQLGTTMLPVLAIV